MKRKRILSIGLLSFLLGGAILLGVWPTPVVLLWHAIQGDFTEYEGWRVPIPRGWIAYHAQGSLLLLSPTGRFLTAHGKEVWVALGGLPDDTPVITRENRSTFSQSMARLADKKDFDQRGSTELSSGEPGGVVYCEDFASTKEKRDLVRIYCVIAGAPMLLSFDGHREFVRDFNSIVHGLRRLR